MFNANNVNLCKNQFYKHTCSFYKHIKIQGLGSDMLKVIQNIG